MDSELLKWTKERMSPIGQLYHDFSVEVEKVLVKMSDADLEQLRSGLSELNAGNCWWAAHRAKEEVRDILSREQYTRREVQRVQA